MAITSMRGYGGQNAMLMRTESISDSLVAMLGSCSSSPHHLSPPELIGQKRPFTYTSNYTDAPTVEEAEDGEDGGDDCSQQVEKKRRLTFDQVRSLERNFEIENKLEPERKMQLAKELGLQPRQVAVWFQNRRARWKTKQLERDYELLTSDYNKLKADLDLALRETDSLKAELQRVSGNSNSEDSQGSLQSVGATELSSGTTNQTSCPGQIEESRKTADPTVSSRPTNHRDRTANPTIDVTLSTQKKELKDSETTTSSGSNSSDVLDADSPRTSESLSPTSTISPVLSTCFQFSAEPIFQVGPSLLPVNEDLYHRSSSCAVKAEDGMADFHVDDAACNYFLPNLVDDQSALPWWEWP